MLVPDVFDGRRFLGAFNPLIEQHIFLSGQQPFGDLLFDLFKGHHAGILFFQNSKDIKALIALDGPGKLARPSRGHLGPKRFRHCMTK